MALRALLVGINRYASHPLRGCVNDVVAMKELLRQRAGVEDAAIRLLTDEEGTAEAILDGIRWLAQPDAEGGGTRLFHFSGHGSVAADRNGDEPDGRDECLVPVDYWPTGMLTDDRLGAEYRKFKANMHVLLVMDSCHSGSVQKEVGTDRRFKFIAPPRGERGRITTSKLANAEAREGAIREMIASAVRDAGAATLTAAEIEALIQTAAKEVSRRFDRKHYGVETTRGNVVLLAGSAPDQTSADARFGATHHGALTYFALEALREGWPTYEALIQHLGARMEEHAFSQDPQLECSRARRGLPFLGLT